MSRMITRADEKCAFNFVKNDYEDSLIELLSEKNINLNDRNDAANLLEYAVKCDNYNISTILMISNYNLELFISLLKNGANPNVAYRNGTSLMEMIIALQYVNCYQNYFEFARALVEEPNFQLEDRLINDLRELGWLAPIWHIYLRRTPETEFE